VAVSWRCIRPEDKLRTEKKGRQTQSRERKGGQVLVETLIRQVKGMDECGQKAGHHEKGEQKGWVWGRR